MAVNTTRPRRPARLRPEAEPGFRSAIGAICRPFTQSSRQHRLVPILALRCCSRRRTPGTGPGTAPGRAGSPGAARVEHTGPASSEKPALVIELRHGHPEALRSTDEFARGRAGHATTGTVATIQNAQPTNNANRGRRSRPGTPLPAPSSPPGNAQPTDDIERGRSARARHATTGTITQKHPANEQRQPRPQVSAGHATTGTLITAGKWRRRAWLPAALRPAPRTQTPPHEPGPGRLAAGPRMVLTTAWRRRRPACSRCRWPGIRTVRSRRARARRSRRRSGP
jgi:hypothetical protein